MNNLYTMIYYGLLKNRHIPKLLIQDGQLTSKEIYNLLPKLIQYRDFGMVEGMYTRSKGLSEKKFTALMSYCIGIGFYKSTGRFIFINVDTVDMSGYDDDLDYYSCTPKFFKILTEGRYSGLCDSEGNILPEYDTTVNKYAYQYWSI